MLVLSETLACLPFSNPPLATQPFAVGEGASDGRPSRGWAELLRGGVGCSFDLFGSQDCLFALPLRPFPSPSPPRAKSPSLICLRLKAAVWIPAALSVFDARACGHLSPPLLLDGKGVADIPTCVHTVHTPCIQSACMYMYVCVCVGA